MDMTYKFGRFWALFLPVVLLAVFFKYLHQLNAILTSIEGVGFRKTLLTLFIAFFAIWSLVYLGSVFFVRAISWIWRGGASTPIEKPSVGIKKELEKPSKNNIEDHSTKEGEELFSLDLRGESAA